MKTKYQLTGLALVLSLVLTDCQAMEQAGGDSPFAPGSRTVDLSLVYDFAQSEEPKDSHRGMEASSTLEAMYDYVRVIPNEFLMAPVPDSATKQKVAVYPRIKKMADGRYIMFYQGGSIGSRILYTVSDDLKIWDTPKILWEPYGITTSEGKDVRRFTTADAVVLDSGEILVTCSYRASSGYKNGIDCGLVLKRSSDNGATWTEDETPIFEGPNWEPYLLKLPGGIIHCYFTDCIPSIRQSGTSVVVSRDNGKTWGEYKKVSRQFKYVQDGVNIYTDQMPSVRLLNDGKTLCGFFEARLEPDFPAQGESIYMMSLVYNDGFEWKDLGPDSPGPSDRQTNLFEGAGGYISVFPSGETLISCNIDGVFSMKIGDSDARRFNGRNWERDWIQPYPYRAFWGTNEVIASHEALASVYAPDGLQMGKFYLNHAVAAEKAAIDVDGDGKEWTQTHAHFIGSESPVQAVIRTSCDEENLYLIVDRKDNEVNARSTVEIYLHNSAEEDLAPGNSALAVVSPSGVVCTSFKPSGKNKAINEARGVVNPARNESGECGYVAEIAIPLSSLGVSAGDVVRMNVILKGQGLSDTFTGSSRLDPSTWMQVNL